MDRTSDLHEPERSAPLPAERARFVAAPGGGGPSSPPNGLPPPGIVEVAFTVDELHALLDAADNRTVRGIAAEMSDAIAFDRAIMTLRATVLLAEHHGIAARDDRWDRFYRVDRSDGCGGDQ